MGREEFICGKKSYVVQSCPAESSSPTPVIIIITDAFGLGLVNSKLTAAFETLTPQQWLEKHTAVSAEDFAKDPTRNRLAVLMSRTNHAAFHTGQAALIK